MKVPIPPVRKGRLEILADQTFVPKEKGINDDVRKLSFLLDEIEIPGLQDAMEPFLYLFDFTPGKKVYFLDEDVWDEAAYRLPDAYRIPDRKMLEPLRDFANVKPNRNKRTIIRGFVYDKFENRKLTQAAVDLLNEHKRPIASAETNGEGEYKIKPPSPGTYFVRTRQHGYGDQVIAVRVRGHPLAIHVPMLPLQ